jgi:hypothetical protein
MTIARGDKILLPSLSTAMAKVSIWFEDIYIIVHPAIHLFQAFYSQCMYIALIFYRREQPPQNSFSIRGVGIFPEPVDKGAALHKYLIPQTSE